MATVIQDKRAAWLDKHKKKKQFELGDKVLVYNSKLGKMPGKLKLRYSGPFLVLKDLGKGTFVLGDSIGGVLKKPVDGYWG